MTTPSIPHTPDHRDLALEQAAGEAVGWRAEAEEHAANVESYRAMLLLTLAQLHRLTVMLRRRDETIRDLHGELRRYTARAVRQGILRDVTRDARGGAA